MSYAVRRLVRDARDLTTVRWTQAGFNPARGSESVGTTPRNLMGQRDGTANPIAGSTELAQAVWSDQGPDWLRDGSQLVFRRIRMDLDTWDDLGLFAGYQADAATAFVPVQRRLAEADAINLWITHVGSAAFVIPPGCREGEFIGQQLIG